MKLPFAAFLILLIHFPLCALFSGIICSLRVGNSGWSFLYLLLLPFFLSIKTFVPNILFFHIYVKLVLPSVAVAIFFKECKWLKA
jgi:hypothetical protein